MESQQTDHNWLNVCNLHLASYFMSQTLKQSIYGQTNGHYSCLLHQWIIGKMFCKAAVPQTESTKKRLHEPHKHLEIKTILPENQDQAIQQ